MFDSADTVAQWFRYNRTQLSARRTMPSRLAEFQITDLFGLYTHRVALNLSERITIIIGPNGRGKTVCLKFIEALFKRNLRYFSDIPFSSAFFLFTNGEKITLRAYPTS